MTRRPYRRHPSPIRVALEDLLSITPTEYDRIATWLKAGPGKRWLMVMPVLEIEKLMDSYDRLVETVIGPANG